MATLFVTRAKNGKLIDREIKNPANILDRAAKLMSDPTVVAIHAVHLDMIPDTSRPCGLRVVGHRWTWQLG